MVIWNTLGEVQPEGEGPGTAPPARPSRAHPPVRHNRPIYLGPEGRRLQSAGVELKECGGKIVWGRPDTGFWVSQETALNPLKRESAEGRRA